MFVDKIIRLFDFIFTNKEKKIGILMSIAFVKSLMFKNCLVQSIK